MGINPSVANGDTPLAALMRETALRPSIRFSPNYAVVRLCIPSGYPYRTPPLTRATPSNNSAILRSGASRRRVFFSAATRGGSSAVTWMLGAQVAARAPIPPRATPALCGDERAIPPESIGI
jgi:hypothetical protein